ncbi:SH3 domain-containing protein [Lyngbya aestuarii]|uniref:SH3 domain-containing protein n=1 Tax=Lyngbya aestuarii TaxID=118322 RepID=UPI00403DFE24
MLGSKFSFRLNQPLKILLGAIAFTSVLVPVSMVTAQNSQNDRYNPYGQYGQRTQYSNCTSQNYRRVNYSSGTGLNVHNQPSFTSNKESYVKNGEAVCFVDTYTDQDNIIWARIQSSRYGFDGYGWIPVGCNGQVRNIEYYYSNNR